MRRSSLWPRWMALTCLPRRSVIHRCHMGGRSVRMGRLAAMLRGGARVAAGGSGRTLWPSWCRVACHGPGQRLGGEDADGERVVDASFVEDIEAALVEQYGDACLVAMAAINPPEVTKRGCRAYHPGMGSERGGVQWVRSGISSA